MTSTVNLTAESTLDITEGENGTKKEADAATRKTFRAMNFREKIAFVRETITVEPLVFCYIMPSVIALLTIQNMSLEKACRVNLNISDEVCTVIMNSEETNYTQEELDMQTLFTSMIPWKTPIQSAIPAVLILFLGSYSDRHKIRKPFMIMPIIGEFIAAVGYILCALFMNTWPMEAVGVTESVFPSIFGGASTMLMAVYAYVADVSDVQQRTLRIGIVHIFLTVTYPIGSSLSGILYKTISYFGVFSISLVLYLVGFYYAFWHLKEPRRPDVKVDKTFCADLLDPKHVVDTFSIIVKKRSGAGRLRIVLLMVVFIVIIGPSYGEANIGYLYTRIKFNWDAVDFSLYSTFDVIIHLIGTTISISVFSTMWKMDDLLLATLACTSKVLSSFVYAFSKTPTIFYLAPVVSIFNGAGQIAMRSIATKLVAENEIGKIQSLFGICEAIAPVIYSPIYSQLYAKTIDTFPGAFFLLGAALVSPSIVIFLVMYSLQKKDERRQRELEENKNREMTLSESFKYINKED